MELVLCPAQQQALCELQETLTVSPVAVLLGEPGRGKTTVLRELHRRCGGVLLTVKDFVDALRSQHPLALEETFDRLLRDALAAHDLVLLDDYHLIHNVVDGCGSYPRSGLIETVLTPLAAAAVAAGKKLVVAVNYWAPDAVRLRGYAVSIADFTPADYEHLCRPNLGAVADRIDFARLHRFAPELNAHHLHAASRWLARDIDLGTDRFLDYLRSQYLTSNVNLDEVQAVRLTDLQGVDHLIEALETHIILPLENDRLATDLQLRPKRGVLLSGPPGTGKTTVGRALAHRLKSKFFLVDGTVIAGTDQFYARVQRIFEEAKQNAPSVLFIDDSDVIFESGQELGLYRYLLTMLDGLESASNARVCVILTAMDVGNLPPALVRSGRIELWLEMRLPDDDARAAILAAHLVPRPPFDAVKLPRVVEATRGFTGADLKRLVEDGKNLFAFDRANGRPERPLTDYFLEAAATVLANRRHYADAEARSRRAAAARPQLLDGALAAPES